MARIGKLIGKRYFNLSVQKYLGKRIYECLCDCGNLKSFNSSNLKHAKSCGCIDSIHRKNYDEDAKKRLLSNIKEINGCWEWQGSSHRQGYGHFPYKRSIQLAHRISWKLHNGQIPPGMNVLHKCDNPPCVNPDHLFLGTQKENSLDMFKKGRKNQKGEKHPRVKVSSKDVLMIRELLNQKISQEIICQMFGITNGHVGSIKHRRTWRHL